MQMISPRAVERLTAFELPLCRVLNRAENRAVLALFRGISWLADWPLWVAMAVLLATFEGVEAEILRQMGCLALVSLPLYRVLKDVLARDRPYVAHPDIERLVAPLDRYSFPSGHTLHSVAFTILLASSYPALGWWLVPFTLLVALSRIILGMHYPSDVLAGVLLGGVLGALALGV